MKNLVWLLLLVLISGCASFKKSGSKLPIVHAHRGSRGTHPENTMVALREGLASGAEVLEFDLHLTSDGVPVVFHDAQITSALCLGPKGAALKAPVAIRKLKLAQLKKYDCGSVPHPRFPEQTRVKNERIPTLEEVLLWVSRTPEAANVQLNIETKMDEEKPSDNPNPQAFARTVLKSLKKYGLVERTLVQSFDFRTLEALRLIEPRLRLSALFEVEADFCAEAQKIGAKFVSPDFNLLKATQVEACHKAGLEVHPWTLNTEAEWARALDIGVDGIITDYPRKLVTYLKSRTK